MSLLLGKRGFASSWMKNKMNVFDELFFDEILNLFFCEFIIF